MDCPLSSYLNPHITDCRDHLSQEYSLELQMKSTAVDCGLFSDSYCKVCSAQLISESQRVAHYESRKHANKVRLYHMLHPADGSCPSKKLRTDDGSEQGDVDKNKCCTLCNMSFTSAVVAQSHYQGKIHAKRLRLLLGETAAATAQEATVRSDRGGSEESESRLTQDFLSQRYCQMCKAWFNNPGMAKQHYEGKKHKKHAAQAHLLAQLGQSLENADERHGLKRSNTCVVCRVTLNSVAQYHAHLQGSKHQNNLKNK